MGVRQNFTGPHIWDNGRTPCRMLKKARLLTRPTPARRDAPCLMQGHNSSADPRFTFHASRFTILGSAARTRLEEFFSILLQHEEEVNVIHVRAGGSGEDELMEPL
jgi:hypothetical protein